MAPQALVDARRALLARTLSGGFELLARGGRMLPVTWERMHSIERIRGLSYIDDGDPAHTLDVYRPREAKGPLPIVLYVHGGGFRALSKDTHWLMGLVFARRGYLVFNINYRLSPQVRFPEPDQDIAAAWRWVLENAERFGGDLSRVVVAGESAGANLISTLVLACCYERPEPWAQEVFELGCVPHVALPACGILQVSDPERFSRRRRMPFYLMDMIHDPANIYLPQGTQDAELADPLTFYERGQTPARPLPPFFLAVGTRDPVLDDSRRMKAALDGLGVHNELRIYPGGVHAFHALVFQRRARECWRHMLAFTERGLSLQAA